MRDDRRVSRPFGHLNRFQCLSQGADLIELHENGVGDPVRDALRKDLGVRDEDVIAHKLDPLPETFRQDPPPLCILLAQAVLNRDDRIAPYQPFIVPDHFLAGAFGLFLPLHHVPAALIKLIGCRVQGQRDLTPRPIPGLFNGGDDQGQRLFIRPQVGREAALVPNGRLKPLLLQQRF